MVKSGFLPIYKMPTKLILLTETLMELAQGFHKQILIDQRDIERWDLKPSQHDPTCIVYYVLVLILTWSDMVWHGNVCGTTGRTPFAVFSPLLELLSEWQDGNMNGNMSHQWRIVCKKRWVSHVASHPFSLTNCVSTCLNHDIRFYQFIKCQQN